MRRQEAGGDLDRTGRAEEVQEYYLALLRRLAAVNALEAAEGPMGDRHHRARGEDPRRGGSGGRAARRITPSGSARDRSAAISSSGHRAGEAPNFTTLKTPMVRSMTRHRSTTWTKK